MGKSTAATSITNIFALLGIFGWGLAMAGIEKIAIPSSSGLKFVWWPEVTVPDGWRHDHTSSVSNAINVLIPKGQSFNGSDTVIYARAMYRETPGVEETLDDQIAKDIADLKSFDQSLIIQKVSPLSIADGTSCDTYTFTPEGKGNWEKVAYVEDGDYFLFFVLSSRTQKGYERTLDKFEAAVASYVREIDE